MTAAFMLSIACRTARSRAATCPTSIHPGAVTDPLRSLLDGSAERGFPGTTSCPSS
jgi:hypothetical protein